MATDRFEEFKGVCKCGKGAFEINYCTPDHPWAKPKDYWYEISIDCLDCRGRYELKQRGDEFVLLRKSDIADQEAIRDKAREFEKAMMEKPAVKDLLDSLSSILDRLASKAEIYRFLGGANLVYSSQTKFTKEWGGASVWIKGNIRSHNVRAVMRLLNTHNSEIEGDLKRIEQLLEQAGRPLQIVDNPVYVLPKK